MAKTRKRIKRKPTRFKIKHPMPTSEQMREAVRMTPVEKLGAQHIFTPKPGMVVTASVIPPHGHYSDAVLNAGARAAYTSFIREAGFAKDARVPQYDKLKELHKARWRTVARDVFDAKARVEDHRPCVDVRVVQ